MTKPYPIAILVGDIHLSLQQPPCRADKDWMAVQAEYLSQLSDLAGRLRVPVLCAGDVFDKWNAPAELINFALTYLPQGMICVPGQHDLPNHRIEEMSRSGYGVLVNAKKIQDISQPVGAKYVNCHTIPEGVVFGFGWNQEIKKPEMPSHITQRYLTIALVHRYVWAKGASYQGAPEKGHAKNLGKELKGFGVAVFGDNHKRFVYTNKNLILWNGGTFIRRKSDEIDSTPALGILYNNGGIKVYELDTSIDKFHSNPELREEQAFDMAAFVDSLKGLGEHGLNFKEAVKRHLESENIPARTKELVLRALQ